MLWWKIYFGIYALLTVVGTIALLASLGRFTWVDYISIVCNYLLVIGLYSYTFKKRIFTPDTWRYLFIINVLFYLLSLIQMYGPTPIASMINSYLPSSIEADPSTQIFVLLFTIPSLYAIYSLQSSQPTKKTRSKKK